MMISQTQPHLLNGGRRRRKINENECFIIEIM